ncbi:uncharacterized protein BP5553_06778 [Venustampulla echinocandica]|uniref:Uncharacterized protein n=1 Tax=Venustampulla echinocandica TaxID=2656787 RepID=A0A370TKW0_9HELO|nr:uncharacterized protein BP5553_06778 [Venustampulla echinocandica]RDL36166.1 hypothetical protein BP5553_06778 [Venustampulla echinocandica]
MAVWHHIVHFPRLRGLVFGAEIVQPEGVGMGNGLGNGQWVPSPVEMLWTMYMYSRYHERSGPRSRSAALYASLGIPSSYRGVRLRASDDPREVLVPLSLYSYADLAGVESGKIAGAPSALYSKLPTDGAGGSPRPRH